MLTEQLDWEKTDGMMPAIVQHAVSGETAGDNRYFIRQYYIVCTELSIKKIVIIEMLKDTKKSTFISYHFYANFILGQSGETIVQ